MEKKQHADNMNNMSFEAQLYDEFEKRKQLNGDNNPTPLMLSHGLSLTQIPKLGKVPTADKVKRLETILDSHFLMPHGKRDVDLMHLRIGSLDSHKLGCHLFSFDMDTSSDSMNSTLSSYYNYFNFYNEEDNLGADYGIWLIFCIYPGDLDSIYTSLFKNKSMLPLIKVLHRSCPIMFVNSANWKPNPDTHTDRSVMANDLLRSVGYVMIHGAVDIQKYCTKILVQRELYEAEKQSFHELSQKYKVTIEPVRKPDVQTFIEKQAIADKIASFIRWMDMDRKRIAINHSVFGPDALDAVSYLLGIDTPSQDQIKKVQSKNHKWIHKTREHRQKHADEMVPLRLAHGIAKQDALDYLAKIDELLTSGFLRPNGRQLQDISGLYVGSSNIIPKSTFIFKDEDDESYRSMYNYFHYYNGVKSLHNAYGVFFVCELYPTDMLPILIADFRNRFSVNVRALGSKVSPIAFSMSRVLTTTTTSITSTDSLLHNLTHVPAYVMVGGAIDIQKYCKILVEEQIYKQIKPQLEQLSTKYKVPIDSFKRAPQGTQDVLSAEQKTLAMARFIKYMGIDKQTLVSNHAFAKDAHAQSNAQSILDKILG